MKKIIVFLFIISIIFLFPRNKQTVLENSIRYRIIANSNSEIDQNLKWEINQKVVPILSTIDFEKQYEIDNILPTKIEEIKNIIDTYDIKYDINYGLNYFPEKEYNNKVYKAGNYQSLVITLGSAEGHNWWCFLFPPLCNLELNKDNIDKYSYDLYIKNIMNKYF